MRSLQYRDFRLLLLGASSFWMGMFIQYVAQGWLVLRITDSAFWVGLVGSAGALPILLLSPLGGVVADRVDRKRLMTFCRTAIALSVLLLGLLTTLDMINRWHILLVALLNSTLAAFDVPARQALVAELIPEEDVGNGVALTSTALNITMVLGPAIGAGLVGLLGEEVGFYAAAAGNAGMVAALLLMKTRPPSRARQRRTPSQEMLSVMHYVIRQRELQGILLLAAVASSFGGAVNVLLPVFARDVLGGEARDLGILTMASGIGAVAGTSALLALKQFHRKGLSLLISFWAGSVAQMAFAASSIYGFSVAALVIQGAATSFQMAQSQSLLLTLPARNFHGRIMGLFMMLGFGASSVSSLGYGALAEAWGPQLTTLSAGAAGLSVSLLLAWRRPSVFRVAKTELTADRP